MTISDRGSNVLIIVVVLVALSAIAVSLRVAARLKRRVGFGVDDYLCFLSMTFLISMLIELVLCE